MTFGIYSPQAAANDDSQDHMNGPCLGLRLRGEDQACGTVPCPITTMIGMKTKSTSRNEGTRVNPIFERRSGAEKEESKVNKRSQERKKQRERRTRRTTHAGPTGF